MLYKPTVAAGIEFVCVENYCNVKAVTMPLYSQYNNRVPAALVSAIELPGVLVVKDSHWLNKQEFIEHKKKLFKSIAKGRVFLISYQFVF